MPEGNVTYTYTYDIHMHCAYLGNEGLAVLCHLRVLQHLFSLVVVVGGLEGKSEGVLF